MSAPPFPPFPPFPANPTLGQQFGTWVWNGAQWIPSMTSGVLINIQLFNTVGSTLTYIPSPGLITAIVECVGGGGGGGYAIGTAAAGSTGYMVGGGGGASGCYARSALAAALVLGGVNVTIGAGGLGGVASPAAPATSGGTTSFGALVVAAPGSFGASSPSANGGTPFTGSVGTLAVLGNAGHGGGGTFFQAGAGSSGTFGGSGGPGPFGGGGLGGYSTNTALGQAPQAGTSGGGGGGAASGNSSLLENGAAGGAGFCIVTEYCLGDSGGVPPSGAPVPIGCGPGWNPGWCG